MKPRLMLPVAALLIWPLVGCQAPAAGPAALSDDDVAAVTAMTVTYVEQTLAGDFAGVSGLFTDDAMIFPPNEPAVSGRAAIEAYLEAYPTITEFEADVVEVSGVGDMAVARGTYLITATVEGMPNPINDTGKWMTTSVRQADGSWLSTRQMWNSDLPLPESGT